MASQSHKVGNMGPFALAMTSTGNTGWIPVGPCLANKVSATLTCGTGTGVFKLQGCVSTASTGTPVAVLQRTSTNKSTIITSTVTTPIGFVRGNSTAIQAGNTLRLSVIVVP